MKQPTKVYPEDPVVRANLAKQLMDAEGYTPEREKKLLRSLKQCFEKFQQQAKSYFKRRK